MKRSHLTICAGLASLVLVSTGLKAQDATHPSENYPGKGGSQDATNGAPNSPAAQNPSTGQQQVPSKSGSSDSNHSNQ
jgi:hypothetical protein